MKGKRKRKGGGSLILPREGKKRREVRNAMFRTSLSYRLELAVLRCAREGNDVADVLHTCYEEYQALETEAETGMRTASPTACIEVPFKLLGLHATAMDLCHKFVIALFTNASADNLTNISFG